jgi:hypothetical protein
MANALPVAAGRSYWINPPQQVFEKQSASSAPKETFQVLEGLFWWGVDVFDKTSSFCPDGTDFEHSGIIKL